MQSSKFIILSSYPRPELVSNGAFDSDIVGWTGFRAASLSWNAGLLRVGYGGTAEPQGRQTTISTVVGRQYIVEASRKGIAGSGIMRVYAANGSTVLASVAGTGKLSLSFTATDTTSAISLGSNGAFDTEWDDVSCRRV